MKILINKWRSKVSANSESNLEFKKVSQIILVDKLNCLIDINPNINITEILWIKVKV